MRTIGNALSGATAKLDSFSAVGASPSTTNAEIDEYVAGLTSGQRLTILYGLQQNSALKVTDLGIVGVPVWSPIRIIRVYSLARAFVNIDPAQPAGTPETHTDNWGGYANGTITAYSSAAASAKSESNALDVTA